MARLVIPETETLPCFAQLLQSKKEQQNMSSNRNKFWFTG